MLLERIESNHVNLVSLIWLTMVSNTACWVKSSEFREPFFVTLIFEGVGSAIPEVMVLTRKANRRSMHIKEIFVLRRGRLTKTSPHSSLLICTKIIQKSVSDAVLGVLHAALVVFYVESIYRGAR